MTTHRGLFSAHTVRRKCILLVAVAVVLARLAIDEKCSAQQCAQLNGLSRTENFDSLSNSGSGTTLPVGFAFVEAGGGANNTYSASDGFAATANTYSYGV